MRVAVFCPRKAGANVTVTEQLAPEAIEAAQVGRAAMKPLPTRVMEDTFRVPPPVFWMASGMDLVLPNARLENAREVLTVIAGLAGGLTRMVCETGVAAAYFVLPG